MVNNNIILRLVEINPLPSDVMGLDVEMTNFAEYAKPRGARDAFSPAIMFLNVKDGLGKMFKNYVL